MPDIPYDELPADSVIGYVRALIPDMEQLADPHDPDAPASFLFDDVTLERYIAMARDNHPKLAAADACMALAGSELLILKKLTTEDLQTDGAAVAKEHRERAKQYRTEVTQDEVYDGGALMATAPFLKYPVPFDPQAGIPRRTFGGY